MSSTVLLTTVDGSDTMRLPMFALDDVHPDWSVLLAMRDAETSRLLAVILDGFGYNALECRDRACVFEQLAETTPLAALVDVGVEEADDICELVADREATALIVLLPDGDDDPAELAGRYRADRWESRDAGPETLLATLRSFAADDWNPPASP